MIRDWDPSRALDIYDHTLRHLIEVKNNRNIRLLEASALAGSAYPLQRLGRAAEARKRLDAAFECLRQIDAYPAKKLKPISRPEEVVRALADFEAESGNVSKATEIYRRLLGELLASNPHPERDLEDAVGLSRVYAPLASLYRRAGQPELAERVEMKRLELWQHWNTQLPNNEFLRRQLSSASRIPGEPASRMSE